MKIKFGRHKETYLIPSKGELWFFPNINKSDIIDDVTIDVRKGEGSNTENDITILTIVGRLREWKQTGFVQIPLSKFVHREETD